MSQPEFDQLSIFPVTTREPSAMELVIAAAKGEKIAARQTFNEPISLISELISERGQGRVSSAILESLKLSDTYASWQRAMPYLKDVKKISAYRSTTMNASELADLNSQVLENGMFLPKTQLLFRGEAFDSDQILHKYQPLSTSLVPNVAFAHAVKNDGVMAVLRISESQSVIGFAYRWKNQKYGHEHEVLLQGNLRLKTTGTHDFYGVPVIEYEVSGMQR